MKNLHHPYLMLSLFILLSACASPSNSAINTEPGYEFSENEVNQNAENGYDFSENEGGDAQEKTNTIILEDEVIPSEDNDLVPESGEWNIIYDPGQTVCPDSVSFTIPGGNPETVFIGISPKYQVTVSGSGMLDQLNLDMVDIGVGGAEFFASVEIEGQIIDYNIIFLHLIDGQPYDYLEGIITSEPEGCMVTRTFHGTPVD